jgi:pimeloyl-ACP methyl ester carboxylesterase
VATVETPDAGGGAGAVLLIHGASSNLLELWGPLADEFSPLHRVIAYDRPGMGIPGAREARCAHDERRKRKRGACVGANWRRQSC